MQVFIIFFHIFVAVRDPIIKDEVADLINRSNSATMLSISS